MGLLRTGSVAESVASGLASSNPAGANYNFFNFHILCSFMFVFCVDCEASYVIAMLHNR